MDEIRKEIKMEERAFPNFDLLDSEIYDDSSYPLTLPSQPPDIRNWISSYESEQSADSTEGAYFHHSHELNESETQDPFEDSRKRKLQEICLSPEKEQPDVSKDTCSRNYTLNSTIAIFKTKSAGTDSVVAKKKQSLRKILGEDFLTNCQKPIIDKSISSEMDKIDPRIDNHEEPKSNMFEGITCKENLEKKCQELSSNKSEQKKEDQIHHTKEKMPENTSEADFISPKSRPKLHGNQENESKNRVNFDKEGHDSGGFRDTSENKTDFSVDAVPTKELSSGKWQCPRKRKPYVGPPLKQLRLEQWIHRHLVQWVFAAISV